MACRLGRGKRTRGQKRAEPEGSGGGREGSGEGSGDGAEGSREGSGEGSEEAVILPEKRRRTAVDYRKLNAQMFGDDESFQDEEEDKDFSL